MKICFIGPSMGDCGGVQRVMAVIANGLSADHEVTMISLDNDTERSFYPLAGKVRLINYNDYHYNKNWIARGIRGLAKRRQKVLPASLAKYAYFPAYLIAGVCNLVKQGEYDCVIGSTVSSAVLVGLMKEKLPGVRLIGWHHNSYEIYFQTPVHGFLIQRKLSAIALRKLDALITLTAHDAGKYQEQMKINAGYIYNPLSFSSQQKSALTDKILLFVGRLERKQKGIDMLLDIAEELFHHRGYGDWKLRIIGNGSGYKDTEEDIRRHGLEDQVELLGEREEVIPFYREASVFVSTSRWEGFGLVITEAMECGLPVVSFRTDGPSEIIRDGQDGILIDNYRKDQFADALERLMTDEELRKRMGTAATERAEEFNLAHILRQWESVLTGDTPYL